MAKRPTITELIVPVERIESRIYLIRGEKVMLDADLAELYQVETFNLNKAVKRNSDRFPLMVKDASNVYRSGADFRFDAC